LDLATSTGVKTALAVRLDEIPDLGVGLGLPSAAMEHAIVADLKLKVVDPFCRSDAGAELVRGDRLAGPADIVALALDRHQRGALDGRRFDRLSSHPETSARQIMAMKHPLDGVQVEIRRQIHDRAVFLVEGASGSGTIAGAGGPILEKAPWG